MGFNGRIQVAEVKAPGENLVAKLGGPAKLNAIGIAKSDGRNHHIKIKYDGVELVKSILVGSTSNGNSNSCKTFDISFEDELVIYAQDDPVNNQNPSHRYWITFTVGYPQVEISD